MTDYEIAKSVKTQSIYTVANHLGIKEEELEFYGKDKAKVVVDPSIKRKAKGKLILVTSTSPTPFGEGKTTLSIGLHDALTKIGEKSLAVLREPSLGPVFGTKGGATGGGMSQVVPMDDINLHFTGDIHAITSCNNLLSAIVDNHIFQGNALSIDPNTISFKRCLDMNDRALRSVHLNYTNREEKFNISTASEMMAILCLATDTEDLKRRLGNIFIGYTVDQKEVLAKDLHCEGALAILLKDAIKPNLVQTLEGNPVLIHGGPFANIAHGCNSVIATTLGLTLADYVITEAGFGSDMGALKFLDIKCRVGNLNPDLIVLNTTIKGLIYNGKEKGLSVGIENLGYHIENMKQWKDNILVVLNRFENDLESDIRFVEEYCLTNEVPFVVSECYKKGSDGGIELAKKVKDLCDTTSVPLTFPYEIEDPILQKIEKICRKSLHAASIIIEDKAEEKINIIEQNGYGNLPICIAKTPYSISDNPKLLGYPKDFTMTVTDVTLNNGAGFITIYMGDIMTMPGLSKKPNYLNMDITKDGIEGIF